MTVQQPSRPPHARLLCAPALHALILLGVATASLAAPPPALPALNIAIEDTSVSGISSGGFMSVQMQVAHSAIIRGAGIVAGSDPDSEVAEADAKFVPMRDALSGR